MTGNGPDGPLPSVTYAVSVTGSDGAAPDAVVTPSTTGGAGTPATGVVTGATTVTAVTGTAVTVPITALVPIGQTVAPTSTP